MDVLNRTHTEYQVDNGSHCIPPDHYIDDYVEFFSILITYGFTFVVGLIGNALIIYTVLHFRRMRTLPNMFLANLAVADILLISICVPIKFAQLFSFTWQFGWFLCKLVHYIQNVSAVCSVYTLTAISIERYYGIIHPVRSRATCSMEKTRWFIAGIWLMAIILAFPVAIIRIMYPINCNAFYCIPDYDSMWIVPYELYMMFIILLLPTVILVYTYSRICHRLWIVLRCRGHLNAFSTNSYGSDLNMNYAFLFLPNYISLPLDPSDPLYAVDRPHSSLGVSSYSSARPTMSDHRHLGHQHTVHRPLVHRQPVCCNMSKMSVARRSMSPNQLPVNRQSSRRSSTLNESSVHSTRIDLNANQMSGSLAAESASESPFKSTSGKTCNQLPSPKLKSIAKNRFKFDKNYQNHVETEEEDDEEDPSSLITCSNDLCERSSYAIQMEQICTRPDGQPSTVQSTGTSTTGNMSALKNNFSSSSITSRRKQKSVEKSDDQTVKQVIKMLAAVVALFIFCWTPILVFNLLRGLGIISRYNEGILKPINTGSHLLSYLNSALNPLIYGFMSRHFRRSFQAVFTVCFGKSAKHTHRSNYTGQASSQHMYLGASKQPTTCNLRQNSVSNVASRTSAANSMPLNHHVHTAIPVNELDAEAKGLEPEVCNMAPAFAAPEPYRNLHLNNNFKNVPNLNSKDCKNSSIRLEPIQSECSSDNL